MKLSLYNWEVSNNKKTLIFNSRTGGYSIIPNSFIPNFHNINLPTNIIERFKKLGFYIDDNFKEFEDIQNKCKSKIEKSKIKKYRILTTTGCNAQCFYCYEKGIKTLSMDAKTALNVGKFIIERSSPNDKIRIEWFGGEPLLNTNAIDTITNYIIKELPQSATFQSSIISNGSKITPTLACKMSKEWHVKRIQLTIDGVYEKYNNIKKLGQNSFEYITSIIPVLIKENIKVDIRINFNQENINDVQEVINFFEQQPYKEEITIYASKIFSANTNNGYFDLEEESIKIEKMLYKSGFKTGKQLLPRIFKTSCMASYPNFFTINPEGKLFKCDRQFLEKNIIGDVYNKNILDTQGWDNLNIADKCKICKLYPLCWGGCFYDRKNGIYPCYLTEKIINNNLLMALNDLSKKG